MEQSIFVQTVVLSQDIYHISFLCCHTLFYYDIENIENVTVLLLLQAASINRAREYACTLFCIILEFGATLGVCY